MIWKLWALWIYIIECLLRINSLICCLRCYYRWLLLFTFKIWGFVRTGRWAWWTRWCTSGRRWWVPSLASVAVLSLSVPSVPTFTGPRSATTPSLFTPSPSLLHPRCFPLWPFLPLCSLPLSTDNPLPPLLHLNFLLRLANPESPIIELMPIVVQSLAGAPLIGHGQEGETPVTFGLTVLG